MLRYDNVFLIIAKRMPPGCVQRRRRTNIIHVGIEAVEFDEVVMVAALDDRAVAQRLIKSSIADRRQPMSDDDRSLFSIN